MTQLTKRSKKRRKAKCGPQTSAYRLYVQFLPIYQKPHKDFNYFSDDYKSADQGLQKLLKRVLNGTCQGRYQKAMLFEVATNTCLKVFLPGQEMTYGEYKATFVKRQPLLKAFIICKQEHILQLAMDRKRHPIIENSVDVDYETGLYGKDIGLFNFRQMLITGSLQFVFKNAFVYDQSNNRKVACYSHLGQLTFLDAAFKQEILQTPNFKLYQLGIFEQ